MITTKRYAGDKVLKGDFKFIDMTNKSKNNILDDILVLDVVNFYYQGGIISKGKKHDKNPQLLVLGSVSDQYPGKKNMINKITGLNLHYLSQTEVNAIITLVKSLFDHRISDPQFVTDSILRNKQFGRAYRQYLTDEISKFDIHYTLGDYADVIDELEDEGSFKDRKVEENRELLAQIGLSYSEKTGRFRDSKTGRFVKRPTELLNNLGIEESDLYQ